MEHKNKKRKTFKVRALVTLGIIALIICIALIIYFVTYSREVKYETVLQGAFYYTDDVKYEFDGKGNGALTDGSDNYEYKYDIDGDQIIMDFKSEAIQDSTYTFNLENDILTLVGGEGTTGGTYTLKKENK